MTAFRDRSGASSGPRRSKLELRMGPISFKLPADTAAGLVWPVGGRSATSYFAIVRVESGRVVSVCVLEQGCHGARWAQGRKRLASGAFSGWIFKEAVSLGRPDVREAAFFARGPASPGRRRASKARAITGPLGRAGGLGLLRLPVAVTQANTGRGLGVGRLGPPAAGRASG
jgi:hypothetical protein